MKQLINGRPRVLTGWLPDRPDHRDVPLKIVGAPPPAAHDASEFCTGIEDQANIGSCTANASTSVFEAFLKKEGRWKGEQFSRLFQYYYTRLLSGFPRDQDTGAYVRDTMRSLQNFGACLESLWPYDTAKFSEPPTYPAIKDARNHQVGQYLRCGDLLDVTRSIAAGYHVVGGFSVPDTIYSSATSRTGVLEYPTATTPIVGGHAVAFVGYDSATKFVKFQNSWGAGWGDRGFGYLPYEFFTGGLASDFWVVRDSE